MPEPPSEATSVPVTVTKFEGSPFECDSKGLAICGHYEVISSNFFAALHIDGLAGVVVYPI